MHAEPAPGRVLAVAAAAGHHFSKIGAPSVRLLAGLGVEGDAHCGETVRHRSRVAVDPTQPNLRQVHLIHAELFSELAARGFEVRAGQLGENLTTEGLDLLGLPVDTELHLAGGAVLRLTGLRNPCVQLDHFRHGLMAALIDRAPDGRLVRKAGVMAVVLAGGEVRPGAAVRAVLPVAPHRALERV